MKTIKQIADEIGVSKTAVRNKIANQFPEIIGKLSETKSGTLYINKKGESLIKSAFENSRLQTKNKEFAESSAKVSDNQFAVNLALETLTKQLEEKDKQLTEKDKQIAELLKLNDQQQQLLLMEQSKALPAPAEEKKKWWQFR